MSIVETLRKDFVQEMKAGNNIAVKNIKLLLGETQRGAEKIPSDDNIIKIIKSLLKLAEEVGKISSDKLDVEWINTLKKYLPIQISVDEIKTFIKENIDFSKLKNKNMAVGMVIKHFGSGVVDGKVVTEIINGMES